MNKSRDRVEIEQGFHQRLIVGDRVDHLDRHFAEPAVAEGAEVDILTIENPISVDRLRIGEDRVGDLLGRRAAIAGIIFDAEIAMRSAGIVAG